MCISDAAAVIVKLEEENLQIQKANRLVDPYVLGVDIDWSQMAGGLRRGSMSCNTNWRLREIEKCLCMNNSPLL